MRGKRKRRLRRIKRAVLEVTNLEGNHHRLLLFRLRSAAGGLASKRLLASKAYSLS